MPVPPPTMLSTSARQSFERLRGSGSTGQPGFTGPSFTQGGVSGAQGLNYPAYIDQVCAAICSAWAMWRAAATLVGVTINGVTASGGKVAGPAWSPLILAHGPCNSPEAMKLTQSIAAGLGGAWLQLTNSISVPGLPWYPTFAAVPSPVAPPTPNVTTPVAALTMARSVVSKFSVKNAMAAMDPAGSRDHQILYEALAEAFEQAFQFWTATSMVTNVLGTGPVPTFAPPYVLVGPVVGGVGTMTPPAGLCDDSRSARQSAIPGAYGTAAAWPAVRRRPAGEGRPETELR